MQPIERPKRHKFMYFFVTFNYICDCVPLCNNIFTDDRKLIWYRLLRTSPDRILKLVVIATPYSIFECSILVFSIKKKLDKHRSDLRV